MTDHQDVRERLRRAWMPFFSRYGRFLPVQLEAIPPVLSGQNVVVCSATASGKTEAVVAPTAERLLSEKWNPLSVLYIVPTRALANDTLLRIEGPLRDMSISVELKHGDKPHFNAEKPPDWLITTPESLDSLLCRHSSSMANVRTVILDELHLIDGTFRGDQLRVLLRRLRQACGEHPFVTHALSATLADPSQVAGRYMDGFTLVSPPGKRELQYVFVDSAQQAFTLARANKWLKALYFCNSRQNVEETAQSITEQWAPYPVVVHHGSLDRRIREEAETAMKEARVAACVCTSTLEVGIDIGDIDLVILVDIPYSISTLLQRLGRGNRRESVVHAAIVTQSAEDKAIASAMMDVAVSGNLPPLSYQPDASVAIQQTFSLLFQHPGGMPEVTLADILSPLVDQEDYRTILAHLQDKGWISQERDRWYASMQVMDFGEKGEIHSNIPDSTLYTVVDITSGKTIGKIAGQFDRVFALGRRAWEIVSVQRETMRVRPFRGKANSAIFVPHRNVGKYEYLLPPELRRRESKE